MVILKIRKNRTKDKKKLEGAEEFGPTPNNNKKPVIEIEKPSPAPTTIPPVEEIQDDESIIEVEVKSI